MSIYAELPDGRQLEFPDGTDDAVIDSTVKKEMGLDTTPAPQGDVQTTTSTTTTPESEEGVVDGIVDEIPQVGGGIVGGLAAGAAGIGAGAGIVGMAPLVGAVALGAAAGEAYKQIGQQLSGSLDAPKTSLEALKRIGMAGVEEGTWEAIGGLAMKGVGKLLAPYKSKLVEGAGEVIDFFKDKIKPLVLLPGEATESRVMDLLQNVTESSIVGGNRIAEFKNSRLKFFDDFADSMIDEFGKRTSPDDLGNLFVASVENAKEVHSKASNVLYNNVSEILDNSGSEAMISTDSLKSFAKHPRKLAEDLGGIEAKNAGDDLMNAVMDLPDEVSFDAMKELRSRLISRVNEFSVLNKKAPAIGKAKKMISLADEAIESGLKGSSPEALEAWRTANRFYKEGQKKFNNTMIRRLIKMADDTGTGAEMIAPSVFRPGQISKVRKVKAVLEPDEWRKMQGFFMQHLMSKSTDVNGSIVGKRLLNNISGKPNSFGEPMLREVLNPAQVKSLKTFGKAVELSQAKQGEGAGKVLIQLTQAGALGAILTGNLELPAATIIFGPAVLSKMLLNPAVARVLTKGVSIPAKSPEAAGVLARLVAASHRIEAEKEKK